MIQLYSEVNLLKENKDALDRLKLLVQMKIDLMDSDF